MQFVISGLLFFLMPDDLKNIIQENISSQYTSNFLLAMFCMLISCFCLPLSAFWVTISKKEILARPDIRDRFGELYSELNINKGVNRLYSFVYYIRRLIIALLAIFMREHGGLQIVMLMLIAKLTFVYICQTQPFQLKDVNR